MPSSRLYSFYYQASPFLYLGAVVSVVLLVSLNSWLSLLAVPLLVIVHHGTHEASHGTLIPKTWPHWRHINFLFGYIGFALVGHNYLLMRWSHTFHHLCGRLHPDCTIDMSERNVGIKGRIRYYLLLLGASAVFHELAGYLYPLLPKSSNLLDRGFNPSAYRRRLFLRCQIFVLLVTLAMFWLGGLFFLFCRLAFLPFWGIGQNVAHYGLAVEGGLGADIAARTYRVKPFVNFLFFGAGFYHAEHHAFPKIPGLLLWHPHVQRSVIAKYGFELWPTVGYGNYVLDLLRQLRGPFPKSIQRSWRHSRALVSSSSS